MSEEGVERRLTTILAADVVGYSRLMGKDEAGTLAALKAHRKEIIEPKAAQYHGRTVKLMGDGTLMEFTSVVDAVNFAVDVQRAMVAPWSGPGTSSSCNGAGNSAAIISAIWVTSDGRMCRSSGRG